MRDGKRTALVAGALATLSLACVVVVRENGFLLVAASGGGAAPRPVARAAFVAGAGRDLSAASTLGAMRQLPAARGAGSDAAAPPSLSAPDPAPSSPASRSREAPRDAAAPVFRILLEAVEIPPDAVTASVTGVDTGAPRALALWRVAGDRVERLGAAASDAGARIRAPQLALPEAGLELVVTPLGVRPGEPGASAPLRLARASGPAPPEPLAALAPRWRGATSTTSIAREEGR